MSISLRSRHNIFICLQATMWPNDGSQHCKGQRDNMADVINHNGVVSFQFKIYENISDFKDCDPSLTIVNINIYWLPAGSASTGGRTLAGSPATGPSARAGRFAHPYRTVHRTRVR